MEIKEAIEIIKAKMKVHRMMFGREVDDPLRTAYNMAISALEKQIPQKPIPVTEGSTWSKCPVCGDTYIDEYCGKCGQKLDWTEVGE